MIRGGYRFLWKVARDVLPVKSNLLQRNITISDSLCKKCHRYEDEIHLLLTCPFTAKVCDLAPVLFKPQPTAIDSPTKLLQNLLRTVNHWSLSAVPLVVVKPMENQKPAYF